MYIYTYIYIYKLCMYVQTTPLTVIGGSPPNLVGFHLGLLSRHPWIFKVCSLWPVMALVPCGDMYSSHRFGRSLTKLGRIPFGIGAAAMTPSFFFSKLTPISCYSLSPPPPPPPPPLLGDKYSSHSFGRSSTKFSGLSFGTRVAIKAPLVFQNFPFPMSVIEPAPLQG